MDIMTRLKGRASLIVIVTIGFTLLIVIYHILSNEVDDISSDKSSSQLKIGDTYSIGDHTKHPLMEAGIMRNSNDARNRAGNGYAYEKEFSDAHPLFRGHKIVHLDLKGGPPKVAYYKYLFALLKKLGATGILVEYEDMFPFEGNIKGIRAGNCYSRKDIAYIRNLAKSNGLIVIPLIQTFGHMEFVLKLDEYKDFREVMQYPQATCPSYNGTLPLIFDMIDQVVSAHPDIKYLHIGADEVYQLGECSRCLDVMAKKQWSKRQLFLHHVSKVSRYIKKKYSSLVVLMWDDEFREISPQEIIDENLHQLIEPVVWKYTTDPGSSLTDQLWESYAAVWKSIWIATAFKGATAPDRYYTDISYHLENHQRWLEIIDKYSNQITFKGIILTGWQRYDHFSVLCELLPVAIPSLAVNLVALQAPNLNNFPVEIPGRITEALQCESIISLSVPEPQYGWTKCNFHGVSIYTATLRFFSLVQEINRMEQDNTFKGWLKPYNLRHTFSNPSHVKRALAELDTYKMEMVDIEKEIRTAMEDIYDNYTIEEWVETYITPLNEKITQLWEAKEKILERNSWPRRPLTKHDL